VSDLSFEQPPWGPLGRSLDGSAGFLEAALSGRQGRPSAESGVKPGMTRRGLVYEYIRRHPGTHVRGMAKELRLATGDLQYHLLWLERHGFIETKRSRFYRYVFPTMVFQEEEQALLGVLSQEAPREIILCLLEDPEMTQGPRQTPPALAAHSLLAHGEARPVGDSPEEKGQPRVDLRGRCRPRRRPPVRQELSSFHMGEVGR